MSALQEATKGGGGTAMTAATDRPTLDDVFAAIGTEICSFLAPRDLLPLSASSRGAAGHVRENLLVICWKQLSGLPPAAADEDSAVSVAVSKERSFGGRSELAERLLENIRAANLRFNPSGRLEFTDTLEETMALAKEAMSDEGQWLGVDGAWYGTFQTDPAEIWKLVKKPFTVGCRFGDEPCGGRESETYHELLKLGKEGTGVNIPVIRDWILFVASQKGVVGMEWQWQCDGHEERGFMVYAPDGDEHLEFKMVKKPPKPGPVATSTSDLLIGILTGGI